MYSGEWSAISSFWRYVANKYRSRSSRRGTKVSRNQALSPQAGHHFYGAFFLCSALCCCLDNDLLVSCDPAATSSTCLPHCWCSFLAAVTTRMLAHIPRLIHCRLELGSSEQ
jgi:hypothetical protein